MSRQSRYESENDRYEPDYSVMKLSGVLFVIVIVLAYIFH